MKKIYTNIASAALAAVLFPTGLLAQQPAPSSQRASFMLSMLDTDGDKKISQEEAKGQLKNNFAFVDSNKDGAIDLDELGQVLKLAASPGGAKVASPSFGTRNDQLWARMQSLSGDEDREFMMVNLIKYREKAKYADGRKTELTGKQADALYAPIEFLAKIGAEVAFLGRVSEQTSKNEPRWDRVAVVRYPSRSKFLEMISDPQFQARAVHKDAGLEVSQVLLTERLPWKLSAAKKRITESNDAFVLAQVFRYRKHAEYPSAASGDQRRTGRQAMDTFDTATASILHDVGARSLLKTTVEGALIGDGRTWDEFRLLQFPSEAAYSKALALMQEAKLHYDAAIEDSYVLKINTMHGALRK